MTVPEHYTLYLVKHGSNQSRETAFAEAIEGDKALNALGLEPVGGAYAQEGDAIRLAVEMVMKDER